MQAIVKMRNLDDEGKAVGSINNNPLFDTGSYGVEFADGTTEVITANIIAYNFL